MNERIVIIDGNSLVNRAYYAMQRPMMTKDGIYTQGIYGFLNMLQKISEDYSPEYLAVAFDLKAPTFRHLEYDQYKAGRKKMPEELAMQMPILKEVLHAMNIKTLELEGYEADDIIGTLTRIGEENGFRPMVITGDKDALQLASHTTQVLITKKGISEFDLYDYDKMVEHYHLTPEQFIDLKGLMGDASDNIPGVPGIGEKTGIMLLEQFGSIEQLIANSDKIEKPALRKKIEENAQLAMMSKRLATIHKFVPIDVEFQKMEVKEPDYERLIELYTKLEFNSFLKKLSGKKELSEKSTFEVLPAEIIRISSQDELISLDKIYENEVYLSIIGEANHVKKPKVQGVFLYGEKAYYLDVTKIEIEKVIEKLNSLKLKFIGHELKADIYALLYYGLKNFKITYDSAIAEYVLNPSRSKYDLKTLCIEKLHTSFEIGQNETADQGTQMEMLFETKEISLDEEMFKRQAVLNLRELHLEQLKHENLEHIYEQIELPLIEVLAAMEVEGVGVEVSILDEISLILEEKIGLLELQIYDYAGCKFNINSPIQLGEILFEVLKLPAGKKTKRGYSTSADVLEKIKDKHPIVEAVLEYRNYTKLKSTYVDGMKPLVCDDVRIRAHFQQTGTATGRISCTEPNLQNIPIRQDLGRTLRKAFVASDENHILVGADYSQIELRVLAHMSEDPHLIDAFGKREDIHRLTAARVLGIPTEQVTSADRSRAKAVNFGVIYGMSSFGLSSNLNISRKEAESYIEDYFKQYEKVKEYMEEQIKRCRTLGYSETMLGRKRYIPEISASSFVVRQQGERLAMNSPIQGSAADIIKLAMIKVYNDLKDNHPNSKLVLQVHDELIIDADKDEVEEIQNMLKKDMEEAIKLSVNMEAEVNTGKSWYDLK